MYYFFEKVLIILRLHTKHAHFKLGVQYDPLVLPGYVVVCVVYLYFNSRCHPTVGILLFTLNANSLAKSKLTDINVKKRQ